LIYLEVSDGFNSSTDSLYLIYWDDEPLNVECEMYPVANMIRISWDEPAAASCEHIDFSGYQMYFEGCEYDTLQSAGTCVYTFYLPEGEYEFGVQAVYSDGVSDMVEVSSTDAGETELIEVTGLRKIYPNPFNPEVTISFFTTESTESTELNIYNVKGQRVKMLVNDILPAGEHSVIWQGKDDRGKQVSSGVYFVRVKIGEEYVAQRKITVIN